MFNKGMQTLIISFLSLQLSVLLSFSLPSASAPSTFSELEVIRRYQTKSLNHVAPVAKKLNEKFILWLS